MTESPDFSRNQDFFRIFAPDNLLAVFSDPTADPRSQTGEGWKAPDRARQDFSCLALCFLPYLPHLLADDPADGIRGVLLHLGRGVGVGVQGEPG